MAQLDNGAPFSKQTFSDYAQKLKSGTIKSGHPDFETILAKVQEYVDWQEMAGVKVRTTANTAAVRMLLSMKKTADDTNKRVVGIEPKIEALHADMEGRHSAQLAIAQKKVELEEKRRRRTKPPWREWTQVAPLRSRSCSSSRRRRLSACRWHDRR